MVPHTEAQMSDKSQAGSRGLSSYGIFSVVYATSAAAIYFALGVVADRALGLTPVVFLVGGLFLGLAAMSYAEGALNHPQPGGSSMFAREAFNELVSFAAGWVVVLDFLVVMALAAVTAAHYLGTIWSPLGSGLVGALVSCAVIAAAAISSIRSRNLSSTVGRVVIAITDVGVQLLILGAGVALAFHPEAIANSIELGVAPKWSDVAYALTIVTVAFTGLEAAASLSSEAVVTRKSANRMLVLGVGLVVVLQVGVSVVALSALPVEHGATALGGRWLEAPLVGTARAIDPTGIGPALSKVVAVSGFLALAVAVNSAMLGVARLAFSLTRSRQIPRIVGRLSKRYGTPWLIVALCALGAMGLALPHDIEFLTGVYAFGAMFAITVAHLSVVRLRMAGNLRQGAWKMPLTLKLSGTEIPVPAVLGAVASAGAFVAVVVLHSSARLVGGAWLGLGLLLYLAYRKATGNSLTKRVEVSERALVYEPERASYGAILVPVLGSALDDDIVQSAGRLAGNRHDDIEEEGAAIEALWFHQIPMALPLDAPIPESQVATAKEHLLRAKAVGEEYSGVTVSTAQVRVRKIGEGIVREAKRRGVDVIVLSAEEVVRTGSGPVRRSGTIGEVTRYVLRKAHCRVVLTIPSVEDTPDPNERG